LLLLIGCCVVVVTVVCCVLFTVVGCCCCVVVVLLLLLLYARIWLYGCGLLVAITTVPLLLPVTVGYVPVTLRCAFTFTHGTRFHARSFVVHFRVVALRTRRAPYVVAARCALLLHYCCCTALFA